MLAMLEARLEKNQSIQQKVACSRAPRGTQYDVHSMHGALAATQSTELEEASTPSVATQAAKAPL